MSPAPSAGSGGSTGAATGAGGSSAATSSSATGGASSSVASGAGGSSTAGSGSSGAGGAAGTSQGGSGGGGQGGSAASDAGTIDATGDGPAPTDASSNPSDTGGGVEAGPLLTDEDVWPTGVNGPKVWPPELNNPWYMANKNNSVGGYPEGGNPPPLDLITTRIKCRNGTKVRPVAQQSAPWETSRHHPPEYAFDEYSVSRWSSNSANDRWLSADLGSTKTVNQVFLVWEVAYGKDYDIQFSNDNMNWTTAKQVRGGNGQADVVELRGTGRYIRMWGVATGPEPHYSLYEFTICAEGG